MSVDYIEDKSFLVNMTFKGSFCFNPVEFHAKKPFEAVVIGYGVLLIEQRTKFVFYYVTGAEEGKVVNIKSDEQRWLSWDDGTSEETRTIG